MSNYTPDTETVLDYFLSGSYDIDDPSSSMPDDEFRAVSAEWAAQFYRWLNGELAKAWDEGLAACDEFVDGPDWATAPMNPYRNEGDA